MNFRLYYRLSLLIPFIFPILFLPFTSHTPMANDYSIINIASTIGMYSLFAILYGGVPYILLVGCIFYLISKKDEKQLHNFFYFLPLVFIPVFSICWILFFIIMDGTWKLWDQGFVKGAWDFTLGFGLWILAIGYFYIAIIQGGYWLFKHMGLIKKAT